MSSERSNDEVERVAVRQSFEKELNLHGYGFQYSVLKAARDCSQSSWRFRVAELPVRVQGTDTKIDFILVKPRTHFYRDEIVCECKRSNPALSNWCFIRAPFVHRNYPSASDPLVTECIILSDLGELRSYARAESQIRNGYHIARAIRSSQKGDDKPTEHSRNQIEDAVSQVLRGLNGYIETIASHPQLMEAKGQDSIIRLVPVVFTTARLRVSDRNLSDASLDTGKIDLDKGDFRNVQWLWYQYTVSIGIKHNRAPVEKRNTIETLMAEEHIRSVAIVSAGGIEEFLIETSDYDY